MRLTASFWPPATGQAARKQTAGSGCKLSGLLARWRSAGQPAERPQKRARDSSRPILISFSFSLRPSARPANGPANVRPTLSRYTRASKLRACSPISSHQYGLACSPVSHFHSRRLTTFRPVQAQVSVARTAVHKSKLASERVGQRRARLSDSVQLPPPAHCHFSRNCLARPLPRQLGLLPWPLRAHSGARLPAIPLGLVAS